ncbi:hypothetical protein [Paenibacillus sp. 32O-W]|uniref:hypothetical protein n=1 Tax=Paenibacillus sp. 32O-W TaxID=1695218 RepID=UPI000784FEFD|nr:hypothetical protein [Paenibacillus sp. 32O-W]
MNNAAKVQFFRAKNNQNVKIAAIIQFFWCIQSRYGRITKKYCIFAGFHAIVIYSGQNSCTFAAFAKAICRKMGDAEAEHTDAPEMIRRKTRRSGGPVTMRRKTKRSGGPVTMRRKTKALRRTGDDETEDKGAPADRER